LTYYSEQKIHSLDCLVLCYQEQRTRGFAAYEALACQRLEAMMCGGILLIKKRLFLSPLCRRATFFYVKEGKTFGLILCNLTHNPNHKIQQTRACPIEEIG
jgi:hypothetical protein